MERFDKWGPDLPPEAPVTAAAALALRTRLAAVRNFLRQAARKTDPDPAHVHELRVWTRRAQAALELFADLLPRRRASRPRQRLKRLRTAAADARDADVFAKRFATDAGDGGWLDRARDERRAAQRPIRKEFNRLRKGRRLDRKGRKLLRRLRRARPPRGAAPVSFGD